MTKIIVTETYTKTYELDVPDLEEATIQSAMEVLGRIKGAFWNQIWLF